jgi:hypothetical protein
MTELQVTDKHAGLVVLSMEECLALLVGAGIGRIGFELDGVPRVLPMNCAVDHDGTVVFRTNPDRSSRRSPAAQASSRYYGWIPGVGS